MVSRRIFPLLIFRLDRAIIVLIYVPSVRTVVSSANSMENKFSDTLAKSVIYKINNKGPSMDPCGTPCVIGMVADKVSL